MNLTKEQKEKLYKRIDEKTGVISHPTSVYETVEFHTNGVPKQLFSIWREECRAMHNDIYWSKIWTDHLKARAYDNLIDSAVGSQEQPEQKSENENIPMIGDGVV